MNQDQNKNKDTEENIEEAQSPSQTDGDALQTELETCKKERDEYLQGWQRTKADYINYKNEEGKRLEDMGRFITEGLIKDMLPALDSFDLALGHEVGPEIERGILLIRSQVMDVLKKRGVEEIGVKKGQSFDPNHHESIGEEAHDGLESGTIAEVVQRGYILRGRVIRPARVKLVK